MDRNYSEVINLSFVSPGLHLNILLKTENMLQFGNEEFSTCAARAINGEYIID